MKLYEIANQFESVLNQAVDIETGEIDEQALLVMNELTASMEEKAVAIASYIKNLDADRKAIEEAKKAMADREKALKNKVDYLTSYLQSNMERCGISEINCPYFDIRLKKNPPSVDEIDFDVIPDEYKRSVTEIKLDKKKMLDEMKMGVVIPGAAIQQLTRLEIR